MDERCSAWRTTHSEPEFQHNSRRPLVVLSLARLHAFLDGDRGKAEVLEVPDQTGVARGTFGANNLGTHPPREARDEPDERSANAAAFIRAVNSHRCEIKLTLVHWRKVWGRGATLILDSLLALRALVPTSLRYVVLRESQLIYGTCDYSYSKAHIPLPSPSISSALLSCTIPPAKLFIHYRSPEMNANPSPGVRASLPNILRIWGQNAA